MKESEKIPFEEALRRLREKILSVAPDNATYDVKEAAEKMGLTVGIVRAMLKNGNIIGAYKVNKRWVIPADSLEYENISKRISGGPKAQREKYQELREARLEENILDSTPYLFLENVEKLTGMTKRNIAYHCSRGEVKGAVKTTREGWLIPKEELENLIRLRQEERTMTAAQMAAKYNIPEEVLVWHCKADRVPGASYDEKKGKWHIPLGSLEKIDWNIDGQGITADDMARRTELSTEAVIRCCESGLYGAKKVGDAWLMLPWCADNITGTDPEYIPLSKAAILAGVNYDRLKWDYKRGNLPFVVMHCGTLSVPRDEINSMIDIYTKYLTVAEVAVMLGTTAENIKYQCEQGVIPAISYHGLWKIARDEAEKIDLKKMPYLDTQYVAAAIDASISAMQKYAAEGKIKAVKYEDTYLFPRKAIEEYRVEQKKYVSCLVVAETCGVRQDYMSELCNNGKISYAEKRDGNVWKVPREYVGDLMCQLAPDREISIAETAKCANMTWLGIKNAAVSGKIDTEGKKIVINEKFAQYLRTSALRGTAKITAKQHKQKMPKEKQYKPVDPATSAVKRGGCLILLRISASAPEFAVSRYGMEILGMPSYVRIDYSEQENNMNISPCTADEPEAEEVKYARAQAAGQNYIIVCQLRKFWIEFRKKMNLEDYRAFWYGRLKDDTLVFDLSRYELWKNRQYVRYVDCGLGAKNSGGFGCIVPEG